MKFSQPQTLQQIATLLKVEFVGSADYAVTGINEIHVVEKGDIVFVDHPKYYDQALNSAATTILINKKVACPEGKSLLISDDPFRDFNTITKHFNPFIAAKASIADSATIGENTVIQPNVFIGNNVRIGKNCRIHANVSIYDNCRIGDDVTIHANTVIGSDAFYYKNRPSGYDQLISGGSVLIEDEVHLGASCTIDRGVSGNTHIKKGTKIDNQVHIGHDTVIGKKCLIAAQTGIAGCNIIEDEVTIWGQVGMTSGISIEKGTIVMAQSGVTKSLSKGIYYGTPAIQHKQKLREVIYLKNIVGNQKK
ncbi:UDP-3-O-(3-hydroxymyristoyl)glucosamine N-acyltransferase [Polaribacter pacificus]|uniref:UDP-3-O-(3-hydroxymyristoyl)glucosamine N-acyltransferase n=1 Tax=Polaribacter pacificus TaxID=1775173 RepID=A0A917HZK6_9FLAO|nr:UDP-3-O-(3-hydroxymyristoyl)glucosamine N-acyltransferase [Polaribacter pacificus]GGG98082.1 UDP-3-O-(3-hydroxymyristoyl)glucosamine N-acyltransferase [Polaribacter pacificus]